MRSHIAQGEATRADGPRFSDVVFEIGVVLAWHLGFALLVVLALGTQASF
jgi:hypothetical protein